jgi:hypothetical protein
VVAGLFEPAEEGCTKEKRFEVLDSKLKILAAPPLHGEVSNLQEIVARRLTIQTA